MNNLYKNSVLYLLANLAVKAASFILIPFYSYMILPSEYGYVYIVVSFVSFMSLFVTCSLHGAITRFYWECKDLLDLQKMYSTITTMVLCTAVIVSSLMLIMSHKISLWLNLPIIYFRIAIFSSALSCFYQLITSLLYIRQEAKTISITSICIGFIQIFVQLVMVLSMDDKAMAMILSQLICAILLFVIFLLYSRPYLRLLFDWRRAWLYFKYSVCQVPSDVSVWLLSFSDRMMMNKMKGSAQTGIYGMGQTLGSIPKFVYFSINKAYVPFVFESYKAIDSGDEIRKDELKKHTTIVFSIITFIVSVIIIFSNNIIGLLDSRYADASFVMVVMLFAMLIDCYRTMFMNPLVYNIKYIKVASAIWSLAALINIGLNYFLIPRYSVYGACFAMIFSYMLTFILIIFYSNKAYYVDYDIKTMAKVLFLSLLACSFTLCGHSWTMIPVKFVVVTLYLWFLSKLININPLLKLKSLFKII